MNFEVKSAYTDGFVFGPKELPVSIMPRSERHRQVIKAEFDAQRSVFAKYED